MTKKQFEKIVTEVGLSAVPKQFRSKIENVAFVIEDEPDDRTRNEEQLDDDETLLGLYHGIPQTRRAEGYGIGGTLPDTITLYRIPIEEEGEGNAKKIREVIKETIWHEVAHHFGLDDHDIDELSTTHR